MLASAGQHEARVEVSNVCAEALVGVAHGVIVRRVRGLRAGSNVEAR
jgi:hypothetical protein